MNNLTFGKRLAKLRQEKNITVKQLAENLQIGASTLSNYERDYRQPDFKNLIKFADFFNVSTDYLLGRTNIPTIEETFINDLDYEAIKILNDFKKFLEREKSKK